MKGREILDPDGKPIRLRGFNLLWWANPNAQAAADVKELGANCVRYMFGYKPAGRFEAKQVEQVASHVRLFTRRGLWVIPTVHTFERKGDGALRAPWNAPDVQREFLAMWTHVIGQLRGEPFIAAWEPLNEPHGVEEAALATWYREVVAHVRKLDARTPIVVEGNGFSHAGNLGDYLKMDDPNVVYSFHVYDPFGYTHPPKDKPPAWPGTWGRAYLAERLAPAVRFRARHNVPVYCGEWGVQTRAPGYPLWLTDVASVLEEHGLHWTHWAWVVKRVPVNGTFDVNKHKKGIYEAMSRIFAEATGN